MTLDKTLSYSSMATWICVLMGFLVNPIFFLIGLVFFMIAGGVWSYTSNRSIGEKILWIGVPIVALFFLGFTLMVLPEDREDD